MGERAEIKLEPLARRRRTVEKIPKGGVFVRSAHQVSFHRAVKRNAGIVPDYVARVDVQFPAIGICRRGHIRIVLIRRHVVAARPERGDVLADDESAADKILEAGRLAVLQARHEVVDKCVVLVDFDAVDLGL